MLTAYQLLELHVPSCEVQMPNIPIAFFKKIIVYILYQRRPEEFSPTSVKDGQEELPCNGKSPANLILFLGVPCAPGTAFQGAFWATVGGGGRGMEAEF